MKVNDVNSVSYYVIQNKAKDGTKYLAGYDFNNKNTESRTLIFDPVFHKAIPFTEEEIENFLSRLASVYFPETIDQGSKMNLAVIELNKSAKCLDINQFKGKKLN